MFAEGAAGAELLLAALTREQYTMPFYLRKSLTVGPLRFNLSKSGIGVSAGIPGFRVGAGPRGNYVHMGRGGLYYRQSLNTGGGSFPATPQLVTAPDGLMEIESSSALQMVDATSVAVLDELNAKQKATRWWPLVGFCAFCAAWFSGSSSETHRNRSGGSRKRRHLARVSAREAEDDYRSLLRTGGGCRAQLSSTA